MKRIALFAIFISALFMLSACTQVQCREPNVLIGKECCLDEDGDTVCDVDQAEPEPEPESTSGPEIDRSYDKKVEVAPEPEPEPEYVQTSEPQIDKSYDTKTKTPTVIDRYPLGKSEIQLGEPRQRMQINKLSGYRTSRDKGYMDWMLYTVRNLDNKPKKYDVDLLFEWGITSQGSDARVGRHYTIEELEPGEKIVINQSLGIFFHGIEELKTIKMDIYDPTVYPEERLDDLTKTFKPVDKFEDMEIHFYGKEE